MNKLKLIFLPLAYLVLSHPSLAAYISSYIDTQRLPRYAQATSITAQFYSSSTQALVATVSGYCYASSSSPTFATVYYTGSLPSAGTYYLVIRGTDGLSYRTSDLVFTGGGTGLTPPAYAPGVEGFPNRWGGDLTGDQVITGSLDVNGSVLSFGTHLGLPATTPAFSWQFDSAPFDSGNQTTTRLRSIAGASVYEWSWEYPSGNRLMSLKNKPSPVLALTVPMTINGQPVLTNGGTGSTYSFSISTNSSNSVSGGALGVGAYNNSSSGSVAVGYGTTAGNQSMASGYGSTANNYSFALGHFAQATGAYSAAIGETVVASQGSQVVVGRYNNTNTNDTLTTPATNHTSGVFIVGVGTDANTRRNAIRVTSDGTVLIGKQGDLSMGGFDQGEQP